MIKFSPNRTAEPLRHGTTGAPLIVLAIATDGFKPGRLLEVSARALDRNNLNVPAGEFHGRLAWPEEAITEILASGDKAAAMHAENGLLEEILADTGVDEPRTVDAALAGWLDSIGAAGEERSPLICFSPDWHRPWLKACLPMTLDRLHKGDQIDVGAIARALRARLPERDGRSETTAELAIGMLSCFLPGPETLEVLRA